MACLARFLLCAALLLAGAAPAAAQPADGADDGVALVVDIDGAIGPATVKLLDNVLGEAEERNARLLILRMDTPGGLSESMRIVIRRILTSPVPVATFVAPSGARAASAGTYILYASHIAAMAPATNLGAATPIQVGGGLPLPGGEPEEEPAPGKPAPQKPAGGDEADKDGGDKAAQDDPAKEGAGEDEAGRESDEETVPPPAGAMERKIVNDAAAYIRGLAELRDRNADWAERAVREGVSLPSRDAAEMGVIDFIAANLSELLAKADGRKVSLDGREVDLATAGLVIERHEPGWQVELLQILTNPNTALILMMIGIYGLIFEFANPGSIGPGVVGAICLLLGLYALNQLPLDYTGFALMLLGVVLMTAEAVTPTFGVLGLGGLVAFVLGAIFLIDSDAPGFQLSIWTIAGMAAVSGVLLILLLGYLLHAHRRPAVTGDAEMVGHSATVLSWEGDHGEVRARGESWGARGEKDLSPGDVVDVDAIEGLTLHVSRSGSRSGKGED